MVILEGRTSGSALRFVVSAVAVLAFALGPDLNSVPDASVRSPEDREPALKSVSFVTNEPHASLDQGSLAPGLTAAPRHTPFLAIWISPTRTVDAPLGRKRQRIGAERTRGLSVFQPRGALI